MRHCSWSEDFRISGWFCMVSYLVKNKKSQATGIGQGQEAQQTGPLSAYGKLFFPFLKDSEINFRRSGWGFGPLEQFQSLFQPYFWFVKTPLLIPLSPHTTRSVFSKLWNIFHSKKKRHFISQPSTSPPKNKALLKQYTFSCTLMVSFPFHLIPSHSKICWW